MKTNPFSRKLQSKFPKASVHLVEGLRVEGNNNNKYIKIGSIPIMTPKIHTTTEM